MNRAKLACMLYFGVCSISAAPPDEIFYNGFETPLVPTNCAPIASHTIGIANFTRWTGTQAVNFSSNPTTRQVDITSFKSVFQFPDGNWPGVVGETPMIPAPTNRYVSLLIQVPEDVSTTLVGNLQVGATGYSAQISATISTSCGDFSSPGAVGSTVLPGCYKNRMQSFGGVVWNTAPNKPCQLKAGQTYFYNLVNADVTNVGVGSTGYMTSTQNGQCLNKRCSNPIQNSGNF